MSTSEQERVRQIEEGGILGNQAGKRFVWDDMNKMIRPADYRDPDQLSLPVTESDMGHALSRGRVTR